MIKAMENIKNNFDLATANFTLDEKNDYKKAVNKKQLENAVKTIVSNDKKTIDMVKLFNGVQYAVLDSEFNAIVKTVKPSDCIGLKDSKNSIKYCLENAGDWCNQIKKIGANIALNAAIEKGAKVPHDYTNFVPNAPYFNNENRASRNSLEKQFQDIVDYIYKNCENVPKVKKDYLTTLCDLFVKRTKNNTNPHDKGEKDLMDCMQVVIWDIINDKQYVYNSKLAQFKEPKDAPKKAKK